MSHDHDHAKHGHSHAPASFGRAFAIGTALNIGFVGEAMDGMAIEVTSLFADASTNQIGDGDKAYFPKLRDITRLAHQRQLTSPRNRRLMSLMGNAISP